MIFTAKHMICKMELHANLNVLKLKGGKQSKMAGGNEFTDFLMLLVIVGCAVGWIIIGIGILKCRMEGRCPKGRICKNSECLWGAWCVKHQRYADDFKRLSELVRELKEKQKA